MGTNITGIGNANAIGFKSRVTGGIYFPPELKDALVGVWSAYGKSNDSTDRNIIKNKIKDRGGDFVISNAAFKLNSGFGKYEDDFTNWVAETGTKLTSDKITNSNPTKNWIAYRSSGAEFKEMHIRILGIPDNGVLYFQRPSTDGGPIRMFNGDNNIPAFTSTGICGFFINNLTGLGWSNLVIEQIPSFEGAFVTDGIDDTIISTKTLAEMGITDEVTVVSMVHQISLNSTYNFSLTNYIENLDGSGRVRNEVFAADKTGIYGYSASLVNKTTSIINTILGDKNDYIAGASSTSVILEAAKFSVVGRASNISEVSSIAWYWTIIANKVLTTDQINQVIAYFNLDRCVEPTVLYDVKRQGLSNDTPDSDWYLKDFSKNGFDMSLFNFAKKGNSGVGKYETDLSDTRIWTQSRDVTSSPFSSSYNGLSGWIIFANTELTNSADMPSFKIQVKGLLEGQELIYRYYDSTGQTNVYSMTKDGEYTLPSDVRTAKPLISNTSGFQVVKNDTNSITITQIPSHAGALCFDGVNDFGKVTGMPVYKDYTVVTDREVFANIGAISSKNNPGAFVETAGNSVYSFGQATSNLKFISTRSISYLSKYSYCGQSITAGAAEDGTDMWLGTIRDNDSRFFNGAIYSLMTFPYSMSEFLIERQLKKHKLGTLYPDMVEFRPIINGKTDLIKEIRWFSNSWSKRIYPGDYITKGVDVTATILLNYNGLKLTKASYGNEYTEVRKQANWSETNNIWDLIIHNIGKSPQKISITIEQDENYVLFNPVINSNYDNYKLTFHLREYEKLINIGDYIPKGTYIRANLYLKNDIDELVTFTFNGVNIDYAKSPVLDTAYNIRQIYNYDSPQEVNITIDEYIRYEDIVQPYPALLRFNDENGNEVSWGGKFKVGSTITRIGSAADSNLLPNIYNIFGLLLNGNQVTSSKVIVEKTIVFKAKSTYIFDNNEPKCILSPRLLRIPNSSYKILGYIPDISGHGNNGVIHNSAYAEGSGVNEDGSYQFDGVDDFVTIPTMVGGKQVLMKVNSRKSDCYLYDQRNNWTQYLGIVSTKDFIAYNYSNQRGKTYIDGILNENITANDLIGITHNITSTNNRDDVKQYSPCIGTSFARNSYAQMALYDFMLFDNISTDDKIKKLNEYVGIEAKVELPPYYWDAYGKTNLDEDKATIQQRGVAVGDYDLTNTNFAYDKMSGFGGYEFEKFTDTTKWIETKREDGIEVIEKK